MSGSPRIDILLATFNGERFLADQLESIRAQTHGGWRVLARDDGSTDGTAAILRRYASLDPDRIVIIEDGSSGLGARGNFSCLMEHVDAEYVMFCDQDDVWLPGKIVTLLDVMRALEDERGPHAPLLVHSDLRVVGPDMVERAGSFWAYQSINPRFGTAINRMLVQNVVTGCAAMFNRKLSHIAVPIPDAAMMHDWWVALVAAAVGHMRFTEETTVLYRQHGRNVAGARSATLGSVVGRGFRRGPIGAVAWTRRQIEATRWQAAALLDRYGPDMAGATRDLVARYAGLGEAGFISRRATLVRRRYLPNDVAHKLIALMLV